MKYHRVLLGNKLLLTGRARAQERKRLNRSKTSGLPRTTLMGAGGRNFICSKIKPRERCTARRPCEQRAAPASHYFWLEQIHRSHRRSFLPHQDSTLQVRSILLVCVSFHRRSCLPGSIDLDTPSRVIRCLAVFEFVTGECRRAKTGLDWRCNYYL